MGAGWWLSSGGCVRISSAGLSLGCSRDGGGGGNGPAGGESPGGQALRVRATGNDGGTQPMEPRWNPAGYMRNVVETTRVTAA